MILSHKHHFAFIHIPKCAGTTVRSFLQPFDDTDGAFTNRIAYHSELGKIDYVHIPLFILAHDFPNEFACLQKYWSFAVVRDPFTRFASSVSQRLRMHTNVPIQNRPLKQIRDAVDESIATLSSVSFKNVLLPPEYIHFQKQVDFIYHDRQCIPDNLYTVQNVDSLFADLNRHVEYDFVTRAAAANMPPANRTKVFRNDLTRRTIQAVRPVTDVVGSALPERTKQRIRDKIYVQRTSQMDDIFGADYVRAFIREYYRDDIALYKQVDHQEREHAS